MQMKAVFLENTKNNPNFSLKKVEIPELKAKEVLIRQRAIGVNLYDLNQKYTPCRQQAFGYEGAGIIEKIGPEVQGFKVGDRVAYATGAAGTFADLYITETAALIQIPPKISFETAASNLTAGLLAHSLTVRTYVMQPESVALVNNVEVYHNRVIAEYAHFRKGRVIAAVTRAEAMKTARQALHKEIPLLNLTAANFAAKLSEFSEGQGAHVVYDDTGKANFKIILEAMSRFGLYCMYGNAALSMKNDSFYLIAREMYKKSAFMTFPSLFDYKLNRNELVLCSLDLFQLIEDGHIKALPPKTLPLDDYEEALKLFEQGSLQPIILIP